MNSEICLVVTVGFLFRDITSDLIMSLRPVLTRWCVCITIRSIPLRLMMMRSEPILTPSVATASVGVDWLLANSDPNRRFGEGLLIDHQSLAKR